ncbi:putative E3 ubiquitin-protein ligase [Arthrobotrys musiformis]|uniref:HECT-type E3 ubiquitin transferase n=1 Tax=Arthrobotrys musiformis TaxID=47236 RepID=A0AAV9WEX2_9PEZI
MPSWPTKLFAPSASSSSHTPPERSTTPPRLYSIFPQLDESVPTLYGHQRSKSHVPPGSAGAGSGGLTSGSGKGMPQGGDKVDITPFGAVRRVGNGSVPEMKVGPCMTCASTVRWPSHLTVFRCTVCLGINDLVPFQKTVKTDEKGKGKQNTTPAPPPPPITVERTRAITNNCIESFLRARKSMVEGKTPRGTPTSSAASNGPRKVPRPGGNTHLMTPAPYPAFEDGRLDHNRRPSDVGNAPSHLRQLSVSVPERPGAPGMKRSVSSEVSPGGVSPKKPEMAYSPRRLEQRALTERMFRPLEEYIIRSFSSWTTIESSFLKTGPDELGDLSKLSGSPDKSSSTMDRAMRRQREKLRLQSPWIDWKQVADFYEAISSAGDHIAAEMFHLEEASSRNLRDEENGGNKRPFTREEAEDLEADIDEARDHLERVLLKAVEHLLKRPGKPLQTPEDSKTLLVIMVCPLLHPSSAGELASSRSKAMRMRNWTRTRNKPQAKASANGGGPGQHSSIIKRILGLLSNLPNESHHFLVSWFSRLQEPDFRKLVDFSGSFITYRLTKQFGKHMTQESTQRVRGVVYADDWQIKAASKVLSLLAAANTSVALKKREVDGHLENWFNANAEVLAYDSIGEGHRARQQALVRGHMIPTSDFYNSMLDYADLIADYDQWESKSGKFSFCQYPFLLSMGSKIQILEYDAKRQMEVKAREAFFNSIGLRRTFSQYLLLRVRRDCLVEDSLKRISESVGGAGGDIKKGLKIEFEGEDGIDIGGLRKEWFLLLIRDIFDPRHGMFVYDEDSRYCYFNPHTFEATEQYFLVGVLLGMAIYNSTILDVALPPVVFKKLLSQSSPVSTPSKFSTPSPTARLPFTSALEDLALFRPALANGLRKMLEFEGDVEATFCRDFVVEVERYGQITQVPLLPGGEDKPVTNDNRREFVDLYAQYLLDTSVARQFDPFKRGFWTVCGGNALNLFQPDEIELLVRGSDEPLDVTALRAVATYENWSTSSPHEVNLVRWFWETFESATPEMQRQLLGFITGSDRIPAMGIANMVLKIVYGGPASVHGRKKGVERYPIARTCFNSITLWSWGDKETLERVLWRAVRESEGFGLK